jgi:hypothetical protein
VAFPALLDTCVLYPAYLCDTLLRLEIFSGENPVIHSDRLGLEHSEYRLELQSRP